MKTAFFASDPNLGRIVCAIGNAGRADLDPARVSFWLDDVLVVEQRRPRRELSRGGRPARDEAGRDHGARRSRPRQGGARPCGPATSRTTTCRINADYRSDRRAALRDAREPIPSMNVICSAVARAEDVLARVEALLPPPHARPRLEEDHRCALAQARRTRLPAGGRASARDRVSTTWSRSTSRSRRSTQNTRQFVAGLPANNVLLTGSRGTGKSSLVKAMLAQVRGEGPAADRGRQGRPRRPARHRRADRGAAASASSCSATT